MPTIIKSLVVSINVPHDLTKYVHKGFTTQLSMGSRPLKSALVQKVDDIIFETVVSYWEQYLPLLR